MLKPKESVAKALRRLGGNKKPLSSAERWKRKKAGYVEDPAEKAAKESMLALTGLADTIITRSGNMEVNNCLISNQSVHNINIINN